MKILFQLAFRSCKNLREQKVRETCSCLQVDVRSHAGQILREDVIKCLRSTAETYPLYNVERQVRDMVGNKSKTWAKFLKSRLKKIPYSNAN